MKFIKKTAALLFCLTLALSVMAVSALADETDPGFIVTLVDATSGYSDLNGTHGKEYPNNTGVTFDIMLALPSNSSDQLVIDAFQFSVTSSGAIAENSFNVSAETAYTTTENSGAYYAFSTGSGTEGVTISSTAVKVGSITFTISGNSNDVATVTLNNFNVKAHTLGDSYDATVTDASCSAEIDPAYTVTIKNPDTNSNGTINTASYVDLTSDGSYNYTILGTTNPTSITDPSIDHYRFIKYKVADNVGSWVLDAEYTHADLLEALHTSGTWGNVVLNAQYETEKYVITVQKPTPGANGVISSSQPNYANDTTYQYDIEGTLYTSDGASGATLAEVAIDYYEFQNFAPVNNASSSGNWVGTETALSKDASSVPAGKYGPLTLQATYTPKVYTITLKEPGVDSNGIISNSETKEDADTTTYYYNIEGEGGTTDSALSDGGALPVTAKTAYTFDNYSPESSADHNWGTSAISGTIGTGKHGNVTLTANFTPTPYTATYVLGDNATFTGEGGEVPTSASQTTAYASGTFSYNIENTDDETFTFGAPVRPGYEFTGWTATGTGISSNFPTSVGDTVTPIPSGVYGDVTLTANWKIVGLLVTKSYAYSGGGNNALILFAVQTKDVPLSGSYVFSKGDLSNAAMFKVNNKYAVAFGNDIANADDWSIYAYIANGTGVVATDVSYVTTGSNTPIVYAGDAYAGDVTKNGSINAGDYGNVVAMLGSATYTASTLDVEARLRADVAVGDDSADTTPDMNSEMGRNFGSIADVRAIMDAALAAVNP